MKIIIPFFLILALFSCKNTQNETSSNSDATASASLEKSIWINEKYYESLLKTKSAHKSKMFADTAMVTFNQKADTATIVWNYHESSQYSVKKTEKYQLFDTYNPQQTPSMEFVIENGKLKIGNSFFRKVETDKVAESLFLAGKYETPSGEIELTNDGKVVGVDSLESYTVWTDYVTMETEIDGIDFTSKSGNTSFYGYQFVGNELVLYEFEWKDEVIGKKGNEVFRWKRK